MSDDIARLIERIESHDAEGAAILVEQDKLGLDGKKIKAIRKAKAEADAAKRTLDALMGADLVPEGAKL